MRGFFAVILYAVLLCSAADKKQKIKPAVVELHDLKVSLEGSQVSIDGTIHNGGERALEKLVLSFHFFDTAHEPVSTLKMDVDEQTIEPGDDAEIHAATHEPPRSVSVEVTAADRGERDVKVINPGPYQIE